MWGLLEYFSSGGLKRPHLYGMEVHDSGDVRIYGVYDTLNAVKAEAEKLADYSKITVIGAFRIDLNQPMPLFNKRLIIWRRFYQCDEEGKFEEQYIANNDAR